MLLRRRRSIGGLRKFNKRVMFAWDLSMRGLVWVRGERESMENRWEERR
jgi:hypothetical protein